MSKGNNRGKEQWELSPHVVAWTDILGVSHSSSHLFHASQEAFIILDLGKPAQTYTIWKFLICMLNL